MNLTEKAAYIKGLAEGMKIDRETNEGKLMSAVLDMLGDVALSLEEHEDTLNDMAEIVSDIEESVYELEDEVFGEEYGDGDFDPDADDDLYDITCSKCDNVITVDYDVLDNGSVNCPNCGELINFDFETEEDTDLI